MKIHEAEFLADGARFVVRFVISWQHPETSTEWLQHFAAAVQSATKIGEVARSNVNVGGLGDDSLERVQVAMNIAKDKHLHYFSPTCAGRVIFFMFRWKIPLD